MKYLVKKPVVLNNTVQQPGAVVEIEEIAEATLASLLEDGTIVEATDEALKQEDVEQTPEVLEAAPEPAIEPAAAEGDDLGNAEAGQEPAASEVSSSEPLPEQSDASTDEDPKTPKKVTVNVQK